MRDVKRVNPGASVVLKYDAVEMGGSSYVYHQEEGRVVPAGHQEVEQLETPHSYKVIIVILQTDIMSAADTLIKHQEQDAEMPVDFDEKAASSKKDLEEKQNTINDLQHYIENSDQRIIQLKETIQELQQNL